MHSRNTYVLYYHVYYVETSEKTSVNGVDGGGNNPSWIDTKDHRRRRHRTRQHAARLRTIAAGMKRVGCLFFFRSFFPPTVGFMIVVKTTFGLSAVMLLPYTRE